MQMLGFFLLVAAAWIVAVFAAPVLAWWFSRKAVEQIPTWLAHILFLPSLAATEWVAVAAIFFAAHDDGEGPPGLVYY